MPLINPPESEAGYFPTPEPLWAKISKEQYEWIKNYLNVIDWKCPNCPTLNFGHNKHCANFRCRIERPKNGT